jgi:hypothetical protein
MFIKTDPTKSSEIIVVYIFPNLTCDVAERRCGNGNPLHTATREEFASQGNFWGRGLKLFSGGRSARLRPRQLVGFAGKNASQPHAI